MSRGVWHSRRRCRYRAVLTLGVGGEVQSNHAVLRTPWVVAGYVELRSGKGYHVLGNYTGVELRKQRIPTCLDTNDRFLRNRDTKFFFPVFEITRKESWNSDTIVLIKFLANF